MCVDHKSILHPTVILEPATVHICMVGERSRTKHSAPRSAMAASFAGEARQPTLADEIEELEKAEKVTAALQAQVD